MEDTVSNPHDNDDTAQSTAPADASTEAPGPVSMEQPAVESLSATTADEDPPAVSTIAAHPLPPLAPGSSSSAGKPRSGSALMSHHANPSLESLPVLPEEEVVEIQFDMSTTASTSTNDLGSGSAKPGSSRNLSSSSSSASKGGGRSGNQGGGGGSGASRPPMVTRVHSVDTYNLDDDAMIAMSMGSLGDGGGESELEEESASSSASAAAPATAARRITTTSAPRPKNNPTGAGPSVSSPAKTAPPVRAVSAPDPLTSANSSAVAENVDNDGGEEIVDDGPTDAEDVEVADGDDVYEYDDRIKLGICAMDKKARSKPMAEILSRLDESLFQVVFFGDDLIRNAPIEEWPVCDVLIAFFSKGYPLDKAKEYVKLRKPFILNDLGMQELLKDRRKVYDLLEASGIDVPRHVYLSRDGYVSTGTGAGNSSNDTDVAEFDDHIEINGVSIHKPFVEKPVDAEDHNIAIYYPTSAGGGCKKLFRKVGNRSSEFYPEINEVRRDGSYIYEEFVETQGTDVKMYTVGTEYGHAEARKSPAVDGIVERNETGKEVRFPVILTFREKEIARRIVLVFKQFVCGFDILRVQEGHSVVSYVCDVNGWSFVKNSRKYYDDCSQILSEHIIALAKPAALCTFSTLDPLLSNRVDDDSPDDWKRKDNFLSKAVRMLTGAAPDDRDEEIGSDTEKATTPTRDVSCAATAASPQRSDTGEVLASAAATLSEGALPVREFPSDLTSQPAPLSHPDSRVGSTGDLRELQFRSSSVASAGPGSHQEELRCVIAIIRHGDRTPKQKLKVNMTCPHILKFFHKHVKDCQKDLKVKAKAPLTEFLRTVKSALEQRSGTDSETTRHQLMHMRDVLERWKIVGLNRKLQIKPRKFEEYDDEKGVIRQRCTEVQLILKWGGNLTKLGEKQSIKLGKRFRHEMYPDAPGGGILRLHSTFRHDLKIKTSDEGRVMKTAAAFAKGLLELEGDLPPILVSLVHKEKGSLHMLDPSGNKEVKMELDDCKEKITANLQRDIDTTTASPDELYQLVGPADLTSLRDALRQVGNPRQALFAIHQTMGELLSELEELLGNVGSGDEKRIEGGEGLRGDNEDDVALSGVKLYKGETLLELTERWRFIYDRLYDPDTDKFDLSRIPDVHDNVRFDVLHNPHLGLSRTLHKLYNRAKVMADCVVPQEYGTTVEEKRSVGLKICHSLLEKIKYDIGVARTDNDTDMRYLINMDYSFDLNINTMGRRIRTRLYFTSESHLHTVLNTLRFGHYDGCKSLLSEAGLAIINATPELCYLTQIVMRVFEDSRRDMRDPRRFRVELLFSPGATATPFHIGENDRETDNSRFDTAPLQMIGRDDLTCQEVEDFLERAIMAGRADEDEYEIASMSTAPAEPLKRLLHPKVGDGEASATPSGAGNVDSAVDPDIPSKVVLDGNGSLEARGIGKSESEIPPCGDVPSLAPASSLGSTDMSVTRRHASGVGAPFSDAVDKLPRDLPVPIPNGVKEVTPPPSAYADGSSLGGDSSSDDCLVAPASDDAQVGVVTKEVTVPSDPPLQPTSAATPTDVDASAPHPSSALAIRKYFWTSVALGSFTLGVGCLLMAAGAFEGRRSSSRGRRYPSNVSSKWR